MKRRITAVAEEGEPKYAREHKRAKSTIPLPIEALASSPNVMELLLSFFDNVVHVVFFLAAIRHNRVLHTFTTQDPEIEYRVWVHVNDLMDVSRRVLAKWSGLTSAPVPHLLKYMNDEEVNLGLGVPPELKALWVAAIKHATMSRYAIREDPKEDKTFTHEVCFRCGFSTSRTVIGASPYPLDSYASMWAVSRTCFGEKDLYGVRRKKHLPGCIAICLGCFGVSVKRIYPAKILTGRAACRMISKAEAKKKWKLTKEQIAKIPYIRANIKNGYCKKYVWESDVVRITDLIYLVDFSSNTETYELVKEDIFNEVVANRRMAARYRREAFEHRMTVMDRVTSCAKELKKTKVQSLRLYD